ncbi:MAG: stage III sporulation protein AC [Clostridiales bacterium]|jgi:stage III sporulation protein AC|nr:stage III sporulation protein AC [Clostridium sp.]MCI6059412.1 stage III sporulation protein AC [Clostridiales bacterium]MDY2683758.1 stage III sporulation protein AC [Eubacteriales bacterium]MEE0400153.1 stage III sporulation protein AC [Christensenellales bacterium]MBS5858519.1 stage III sporulation protein AC [Clostridium sp.]
MGIEIILKIAGVGMLTAIVNVILKKSDKDEIGTFVTIVGIVVVLMMVVDMLTGVMDTVKQLFGLK